MLASTPSGPDYYAFDASGREIALHSSIGWSDYQINVAGRRMMLFATSLRWLFHPNALGSSTMVTDQTGAVVQDATYYPWGQLWQSPGSFGGNWNFAAFGVLEPTTNLYPTPFRHQSSTQGRWLSPDPMSGSILNPQSLNRYIYALNNPCSLVDALGLDPCNFNIAINNQAGLGSVQTNAIEAEINAIFTASPGTNGEHIGATFNQPGYTDYSATIVDTGSGSDPYGQNRGLEGTVYFNLLEANNPSATMGQLDRMAGAVIAHEFAHGEGDFPDGGLGLMGLNYTTPFNTRSVAPPYVTAQLKLMPEQVSTLYQNCTHLHPNQQVSTSSASAGGGGGGGGGSGGGSLGGGGGGGAVDQGGCHAVTACVTAGGGPSICRTTIECVD